MADPILISLRDNVVTSLEVMGTGTGFNLDYREVIRGSQAAWDSEKDFARPAVHVRWDGALPGDARTGVQDAASGSAGRQRHYERFLVSAAIKAADGDTEARCWRFRADVERALILTSAALGLNRNRGVTRSTTFEEPEIEWAPIIEGGTVIGGVFGAVYVVRWDHVAGDMGTG